MAIVQNPITGRSKGKFANAVFSKWKDKNTLRAKALEVHNPNTPHQQLVRSKMSVCVKVGRGVLDIIRMGFKEFATSQSEWNEFIKEALANLPVVAGIPSLGTAINMPFSKGSILTIQGASMGTVTTTGVSGTWTNNTNGTTGLSTDQLRCIVVNVDTGESFASATLKTRADATGTFVLPSGDYPTGNYNYFLAILRPSEGKAGDSVLFQ